MKVLFLDNDLIFSVIPRVFPSLVDNLSLNLINENSKTVVTPDFTFDITDKLVITITETPTDFKIQNKYSIEIKNDNDIIYLGKLLVLENGTDVQNYEYQTKHIKIQVQRIAK